MDYNKRFSAAPAADIGAGTQHVHETFGVPVSFVDTSRGTFSVVNAETCFKIDRVDGLVLTASMLTGSGRVAKSFRFDLAQIRKPVLVAHHHNDDCW